MSRAGPEGTVDFEALKAALSDPSAYPGQPDRVEVRETHASCAFLVGDEVYKLKKPVNFGFLDYSTLARRRLMCRREIELNRRLAPGVYLGVVPVTRSTDGRLLPGGRGPAVDYLVWMRRLDDARMLSSLVRSDEATMDAVIAIGRHLAAFHAKAGRSARIDSFGSAAAILRNQEENCSQVGPFAGIALSQGLYHEVCAFTGEFVRANRRLLRARVEGGWIRDGHGDLRCDHVYLQDGIQVIDCIEFNQRFRYADTASDIAFLAMDLEAHGAPDLARGLTTEYARASGGDLEPVLRFYLCYRAFTRGKVACLRAIQRGQAPAQTEAELDEARRFFHLALRYARDETRPVLVITSGVTGTGKSTLAEAIGGILAATVVSADPTRKRIADLAPGVHRDEAVDTGIYSPEMNLRTYGEMLARAERELARGRSVVLDATYRRRLDRDAVRFLARRAGARFLAVECVAPEAVVRERIERRRAEGSSWSDGRWELYLDQVATFEPLLELAPGEGVRIDTSAPRSRQLDAFLSVLEGGCAG